MMQDLVDQPDHAAVVDALLRFGAGVDRGDAHLLASAFAQDAAVHFGPCGRVLGLDFPMIEGGAVVEFLGATATKQITTHAITNPRVRVDGNAARLLALVEATHIPRGDPSRRFRMMNWYEADLVGATRSWRISRIVIENVWHEGDPQILMGR